MDNPLISIIIPVYNTEKYLRQCLDSVVAQTYTNWECLLIDDGSKDASGAICDDYAAKDPRFRVFHKENGGVSSARNIGIEKVSGEWITFCDADDYYAEGAFDIIFELLNLSDVEMIGWQRKKTHGESVLITDSNPKKTFNSMDFINSKCFLHAVWAYAFKVAVIRKNNIKFPEGIRYSEDQNFLFKYIAFVSKIIQSDAKLYCYFQNEDSATMGGTFLTSDQYLDNLRSSVEFYNYAQKNDLNQCYVRTVLRFIFSYYINYIGHASDFSYKKCFFDLNGALDSISTEWLSVLDRKKIRLKYNIKYMIGLKQIYRIGVFIKSVICKK